VGGVPPEVMGIGPIAAVPKALKYAGMSLSDIDLIELNEAFAAQGLAVMRELEMDEEIRSTSTAGRLRWATRWAAPGPSSPCNCCTSWSGRASAWAL
jgi:acetyl-CoA acetyltransferase